MNKWKFGKGFKGMSRYQLALYWFFIGFSLGATFMMLMLY